MNSAEQMVSHLCRNSFLSLWSYSNPRRRDGRELCDILVVCDPDILIFSVKEVRLTGKDAARGGARWNRKAVEQSIRQLHGAEREIARMTQVIRVDGSMGLIFPEAAKRRIYRIAVAIGSDREVSTFAGDTGHGYIHIFDETSIDLALRELDTVTDFVEFLREVEESQEACKEIVVEGGVEELLGWYILNGRKLPRNVDLAIYTEGIWEEVSGKREFLARKKEDEISYAWDELIELLSENLTYSISGPPPALTEAEMVVRTMARETRFGRRELARTFAQWHQGRVSRSRIVLGLSGVTYVFLATPVGYDRKSRIQELAARCFIARGKYVTSPTIVGIATEEYNRSGFSIDAVYLYIPEWTDGHAEDMRELQAQSKIFTEVRESRVSDDEFPRENPSDRA